MLLSNLKVSDSAKPMTDRVTNVLKSKLPGAVGLPIVLVLISCHSGAADGSD